MWPRRLGWNYVILRKLILTCIFYILIIFNVVNYHTDFMQVWHHDRWNITPFLHMLFYFCFGSMIHYLVQTAVLSHCYSMSSCCTKITKLIWRMWPHSHPLSFCSIFFQFVVSSVYFSVFVVPFGILLVWGKSLFSLRTRAGEDSGWMDVIVFMFLMIL